MLADQGKSDYRIVIGEDASSSERHAAGELRHFLKAISGAELRMVSDLEPRTEKEIILGDNEHLRRLGIDLASLDLGDEGFLIKTLDDTLVIAGGRIRGTMYGVYTFLEQYLGCRWFTPDESRIPRQATVGVGNIDQEKRPALEWREPSCGHISDADWAARNKVNGRSFGLDERRGGKLNWQYYVHTFNQLLPPEQYFERHPEYYSEIEGDRTAYRSQLCLTNPDVLALVTDKVRQWVAEDSESTIVSVSQNDRYRYCQCPNCAELDEREGSPSGTMIWFVNQVAEAIEKDYPQVSISTLAYQYTRKAPRSIRPRHNVIPHLCSIECCCAHPLTECERNASFVDDIRKWSQISNKLYVWDYVTEFGHYISPWPNLYSLQPNIQFFIENSVRGIFEQGPGTTSEFAELRTYLLAKLLWNPDINVSETIDDFLLGYYGAAARPIRDYIELLHQTSRERKVHSHIWSPLNKHLFTADFVNKSSEILGQAERAAENEVTRYRVQIANLPIQYVKLVQGMISEDDLRHITDEFFRIAENAGIPEIREGTPLREFHKDIWTLHSTRDRYEALPISHMLQGPGLCQSHRGEGEARGHTRAAP